MKVEQTVGNGGVKQEGVFTITQNNGSVRQCNATLYQWGRKDALPGTDDLKEGTFIIENHDKKTLEKDIQHPEIFYAHQTWKDVKFYNLWSMDNTIFSFAHCFNDNSVIKTIYDPCPAGFKMPASNAFTGFTTTGDNTFNKTEFNIKGDWDFGWHFNNKLTTPNATLYMPAVGFRNETSGLLIIGGEYGYVIYFTAEPNDNSQGCSLSFAKNVVQSRLGTIRATASAVRPVSE